MRAELVPNRATEPTVESVAEAREAVRPVLEKNEKNAHLTLFSATVDDGKRRSIRECPKCQGKFHYVGRIRRPEGNLSLGGVAVCECCGHRESVRS